MYRTITLAGTALLLAACTTATPYGPASGSRGYGFSDQRIEENRYRVTFRGNSVTSRSTVSSAARYKSAFSTVSRDVT
ncbi:MAG: hypothetical protein AAFW68_14195, partial [Pseudomonadota bacterium]